MPNVRANAKAATTIMALVIMEAPWARVIYEDQELADEAFRDLLHKYKPPTDLKAALRESARPSAVTGSSRQRRPKERR
jgi:hypothetical protein